MIAASQEMALHGEASMARAAFWNGPDNPRPDGDVQTPLEKHRKPTPATGARAIEPLKGYDAAHALRGWPDAAKAGAPEELAGSDSVALRAQVWLFMSKGRHRYVELSAWSFELNGWIRMEAFEASTMSLADTLAQETDFDFDPPRLDGEWFRPAEFD